MINNWLRLELTWLFLNYHLRQSNWFLAFKKPIWCFKKRNWFSWYDSEISDINWVVSLEGQEVEAVASSCF
jgi:hypothetical protein